MNRTKKIIVGVLAAIILIPIVCITLLVAIVLRIDSNENNHTPQVDELEEITLVRFPEFTVTDSDVNTGGNHKYVSYTVEFNEPLPKSVLSRITYLNKHGETIEDHVGQRYNPWNGYSFYLGPEDDCSPYWLPGHSFELTVSPDKNLMWIEYSY